MGAHVVLFTTSPAKVADGLRLGADEVCVSSDPAQLERLAGQLDTAFERKLKSDVRYRFVIDMASLSGAQSST